VRVSLMKLVGEKLPWEGRIESTRKSTRGISTMLVDVICTDASRSLSLDHMWVDALPYIQGATVRFVGEVIKYKSFASGAMREDYGVKFTSKLIVRSKKESRQPSLAPP